MSIWPACPDPESFSAPAALAGHSSAGNLTNSHTALPPRSAAESQGNSSCQLILLHTTCFGSIHQCVSKFNFKLVQHDSRGPAKRKLSVRRCRHYLRMPHRHCVLSTNGSLSTAPHAVDINSSRNCSSPCIFLQHCQPKTPQRQNKTGIMIYRNALHSGCSSNFCASSTVRPTCICTDQSLVEL